MSYSEFDKNLNNSKKYPKSFMSSIIYFNQISSTFFFLKMNKSFFVIYNTYNMI